MITNFPFLQNVIPIGYSLSTMTDYNRPFFEHDFVFEFHQRILHIIANTSDQMKAIHKKNLC